MPGVELARAVVELDLGVERARRRIERGREAHDLARERSCPGSASSSTWASLPTRDAGELALVDGDEHAQRVDARDGDDRAAARRADQRARIEPALHDDARRAASRCASRRGARPARAICACAGLLRGLGGRELALRLLQLLLRHDRLGRELLGAIVVGARERRRRLRLRQRAARRRQLIGQIAGPHQRQQLAARRPGRRDRRARRRGSRASSSRRPPARAAADRRGRAPRPARRAPRPRATDTSGGGRDAALSAALPPHAARKSAADASASEGGRDSARAAVQHGASIADHHRRSSKSDTVPRTRRRRRKVRQHGHLADRDLGLECRA